MYVVGPRVRRQGVDNFGFDIWLTCLLEPPQVNTGRTEGGPDPSEGIRECLNVIIAAFQGA
jgi:hypothetical protein